MANRMTGLMLGLTLSLTSVSTVADLSVERSAERIARGEYLTLHVMGCQGCHSERALDRYGYPPKEDGVLAGGLIFRDIGERAITPNITPFALGDWSDQELFDAITRGVRPDGRVLHPDMPYDRYGTLARETIYEIIAYLRDIAPIAAGPYPAEFPGDHPALEPRFDTLTDPGEVAGDEARGAYLVTAAGCNGCHVGTDNGVDSVPLAGGREFRLAGRGLIRAANLTPHLSTGLGAWSREAFIARFQAMRGSENTPVTVGEPNTTMHWWEYAYMTTSDLQAVHAYIMSLPPTENRVVRFEPLRGELISPNWSEQ